MSSEVRFEKALKWCLLVGGAMGAFLGLLLVLFRTPEDPLIRGGVFSLIVVVFALDDLKKYAFQKELHDLLFVSDEEYRLQLTQKLETKSLWRLIDEEWIMIKFSGRDKALKKSKPANP